MPVKVFGSPATAEVARVMACLFEKDVDFQLIRVDSFHGPKRLEQHKLQPHSEALTFEDGNVILFESRKAIRHVADKYKTQGCRDLYGPGALERASIEQWLQMESSSFDVPTTDLVYSLAYLPADLPLDSRASAAGMHPAHRQKAEEMLRLFEKSSRELGKVLDIYEQRLGEEEYLAGSKFTIADLSHLPKADSLAADPRLARLIESRRNVRRWWRDISGRESWRRIKELQRPPAAEAPF